MDIVKVRVGDCVFETNKSLLLRECEYFRALYRSGMVECHQEEIHVRNLKAQGFVIMLAVASGDRPILNDDEILEAIECAAFFQAEPLARHLQDLLNSNNCLLMYQASATYGLWGLHEMAAQFIRNMYCDLQENLKNLPQELTEYVESLVPSVFVAVGSHSTCTADELPLAATRTVCYLNENDEDWKVLTALPMEASTSLAGLTVLDNRLYIVGGVHGVDKRAVDASFCYDVVTDTWTLLPGPRQPRYNFTLIGIEGCLYAIGGESERTIMSSVEIYNVTTKDWTFAASLPRPVAGVACTKAMSRIFVCLWKPMETNEIYEYIPKKNVWVLVSTLLKHQSYGHCMVAHRDNLYLIRNGPQDDFLRCLMDCYNITTGQWTSMPGHYGNSKGALFTAVVRGDSVFTLNRTMTLEYTVAGNMWKPCKQMKGFPRNGSVWTFLLRIPKERKEVKVY
ncbi:kelch repeat and BTB domain-containing protein 13 [Megalobrama amblycephala]|uniref:kelch repeat and BTB domain-containing protein 13 n=1 Tax=Megalobrama amblycephala TaxID=75352 RepID=UPI002013F6F2|nr:kelch repeat and BTB domain-containing protein 13 [Megalobrama amblycephala]